MKEFRIMCDHVMTDNQGRSWIRQAVRPIGSHGNSLISVFQDKGEAEATMAKWEQYGNDFERERMKMRERFPNLYDTLIHQVNYRIQSREVTSWE